MNRTGQLCLAVLAIVGVIALVTFGYHFLDEDVPPPKALSGTASSLSQPRQIELRFENPIVTWDPPWMGDVEQFTGGHYDYWFTNENDVAAELGMLSASCKCSRVELCVMEKEQAARYRRWALSGAASVFGQGACGIPLQPLTELVIQEMAVARLLEVSPDFKEMLPNQPSGSIIPPRGGGIVRLIWAPRKEKLGQERLSVSFWTMPTTGDVRLRSAFVLELPITFVAGLRYKPISQPIDEIGYKDSRIIRVLCASSTRASFPLEVFEKALDPCFSYKIEPMDPREMDKVAKALGSRILTGYDVQITLRERTEDGKQMELGPFNRHIVFRSSPDIEEQVLGITGTVRGEVSVGNDKKGRIALGSFPKSEGTRLSVPIQSEQDGLDIDMTPSSVSFEPASLKNMLRVDLKKLESDTGSRRHRWRLQVTVLPESLDGRVPDRSAVYLKTMGQSPRLIRIPVDGLAYLK